MSVTSRVVRATLVLPAHREPVQHGVEAQGWNVDDWSPKRRRRTSTAGLARYGTFGAEGAVTCTLLGPEGSVLCASRG